MGRSNSTRSLIAAWTVLAGFVTTSLAHAPEDVDSILLGAATWEEFTTAARAMDGQGKCRTNACRAIDDILSTAYEMRRRCCSNTMASLDGRPMNADAPRRVEQAIRRLVRASVVQREAHCAVLVQLARTYAEYSLGYVVVELAERITRHGFPCATRVLAVLPRIQETEEIVSEVLFYCNYSRRRYCRQLSWSVGDEESR